VKSSDKPPNLFQLFVRHLIENTATYFREYRVVDTRARNFSKGLTVRKWNWSHNWDLNAFAIAQESMFLKDLLLCPTPRSVKLHHSVSVPPPRVWRQVNIELNFVHSILKAIEREHSTSTPHSERLNSIKDSLRSKFEKEFSGWK
jgi:hypothetical protein